jgi:hypothetical protein
LVKNPNYLDAKKKRKGGVEKEIRAKDSSLLDSLVERAGRQYYSACCLKSY